MTRSKYKMESLSQPRTVPPEHVERPVEVRPLKLEPLLQPVLLVDLLLEEGVLVLQLEDQRLELVLLLLQLLHAVRADGQLVREVSVGSVVLSQLF